jgi:predicted nucleic acid-binding Zn ribbon protein
MNNSKRDDDSFLIGDVLKQFIQKNKLEKGLDAVDVKQAWINLMGAGVNNYTQEVTLKNGVLYVWLTSAVLREELLYGKQKIIKMMNEEVGKTVVNDLILR